MSRKPPDFTAQMIQIFLWIWFLSMWRYFPLYYSCLPFLLICVYQCPSCILFIGCSFKSKIPDWMVLGTWKRLERLLTHYYPMSIVSLNPSELCLPAIMKFQSVPRVPHLLCTFLFVKHYYPNQDVQFIIPHTKKLSFGLWMFHWLYSVQNETNTHNICIHIKSLEHKDILEFQKVPNGPMDVFHDSVTVPTLPKRRNDYSTERKVSFDRRSFVPLPLFNDFVQKVHDNYPESTRYFNKMELVKHLMAADNDHERAFQRIRETMKWKEQFNVLELINEDYESAKSMGKLYWSGRARSGSPILIWRGCKQESLTEKETLKWIVHIIENSMKDGLLQDKMLIIIDLIGVETINKDYLLIKHVCQLFEKHYPNRIEKIFVFPKTLAIEMAVNMIKLIVSPNIGCLCHVISARSHHRIRQYIGRETLLIRFGGIGLDPTEFGESTLQRRLLKDSKDVKDVVVEEQHELSRWDEYRLKWRRTKMKWKGMFRSQSSYDCEGYSLVNFH